MTKTSMLLTLLSVSATAAAIGLLYAPNKGVVTREKLSKKGHQYSDYVADRFDDVVSSIANPLKNLEEETVRLANKAKAKAERKISEVNSISD